MNRFDLESRIAELHSIVDSLNDISYGLIEADLSKDETIDVIDGLAVVAKMKIDRLFNTFAQVFSLDKYSNNEQLELSEEIW